MATGKQLDQNISIILQSIEKYQKKYSDSAKELTLIAVSKTRSIEQILELYNLGQHDFAENYLSEAIQKIDYVNNVNNINLSNHDNKNNLSDFNHEKININWHYIGQIQSNKTKTIAENFNWVHSVDRFKIAQRLSSGRPESQGKLNILIQVNIENDPNKAGVKPEDAISLALKISELKNIQLRGFMCILTSETSKSSGFDQQYNTFNKLNILLTELINTLNKSENKYNTQLLDTLSMGMSNDYEAAIAAGSTMVRIGSAIFN